MKKYVIKEYRTWTTPSFYGMTETITHGRKRHKAIIAYSNINEAKRRMNELEHELKKGFYNRTFEVVEIEVEEKENKNAINAKSL